MLNSNQVFDIIEKIGSIGSTNEKREILKSNIKDELFQKIVELSVNPAKTFGIVPTTEWINKSDIETCFTEDTFDLLNKLIDRNLTGHAARDSIILELSKLSNKSAELLVRIIRKDLRAGFSANSVNKVMPGLIPEYPYMRCSTPKKDTFKKWDFSKGVYSQLKSDGLFASGNSLDQFEFISRAGNYFPMEEFSDICEEALKAKNNQLHGEILVVEDGKILPRTLGNGILNSILQGAKFKDNQKPLYVVWDIIPVEESKRKNKYKVPYSKRIALLEEMFKDCKYILVTEYEILYSLEECYLHAARLIKEGHEGTVIKNPDAIWEDGTSKNQIKIKVEFDCDLVIKEILPGKVNTKNEGRPGALRCESSDGIVKVNITVKNDKMRNAIEANPQEWIGKIVTVLANDITTSGNDTSVYSLFLPRLVEDIYRIDKTEADDYQKIRDALDAVIQGKKLIK